MPINAVAFVLFVYVLGEAISAITGVPVPGAIIGLLILFAGFLLIRRIPREAAGVGDPMLSILPLLFIPSGVKVFEYTHIIGDMWPVIAAAIMAGTVVGLAATIAAGRLLIDEKAFAKAEFISLPEDMADIPQGHVWLVPTVAGVKAHEIALERLTGAGVTLGRGADCAIIIENNTVSKHHARLSWDASDRILVDDLDSANGSWRDGRRLKSEMVADGETVRFAAVEYRMQVSRTGKGKSETFPGRALAEAAASNTGAAESVPESVTIAMPTLRVWELRGIDDKGNPVRISLVPRLDTKGIPCQTSWRLGRKAGADFILASSSVSALHAEIQFHPIRGLEVRDLQSTNGSKVDGRRLNQTFVPLASGQVLEIGDLKLTVEREQGRLNA